jgi:phage-related protein
MADFSDGAWCPDTALERTPKWRLDKTQFGDGYQQRALDGINALDLSFRVSWSIRPRWMLLEMNAYLEGRRAKSFPFLDPGFGEIVQVFCDEWAIAWQQSRPEAPYELAAYGQLSATFVKANGITV